MKIIKVLWNFPRDSFGKLIIDYGEFYVIQSLVGKSGVQEENKYCLSTNHILSNEFLRFLITPPRFGMQNLVKILLKIDGL